jgi:hypothetical protein
MKCSLSDLEGLSAEIENQRTLGPEELNQSWRDLFGSVETGVLCWATRSGRIVRPVNILLGPLLH